jgi:hypothetical protein
MPYALVIRAQQYGICRYYCRGNICVSKIFCPRCIQNKVTGCTVRMYCRDIDIKLNPLSRFQMAPLEYNNTLWLKSVYANTAHKLNIIAQYDLAVLVVQVAFLPGAYQHPEILARGVIPLAHNVRKPKANNSLMEKVSSDYAVASIIRLVKTVQHGPIIIYGNTAASVLCDAPKYRNHHTASKPVCREY